MTPESQIPVIDIHEFREGSPSDRRAVAHEVGAACRHFGFLQIVGHGIEEPLINAAFNANRDFHDLSQERKEESLISESANHRGYHPFGAESTDPDSGPDLKEAFDMALELSSNDPDALAGKPLHGPNVWPRNLPGFRETLTAYYDALVDLGATLCKCFAIDLGLAEDYFVDKHSKPMAQLRLLHYPELDPSTYPNQMGAGEHTDYGSVAILSQDQIGGLEIRGPSEEWIPVEPLTGAFVCNLGDMMEIWTNGLYPATCHRVIHSGPERFSQVLFYDPNYDCRVEPLEVCCSPERPPRYEPVIMGPYLKDLFDTTFAYRKRIKDGSPANKIRCDS
jgi:isopenicillin N synthase-like dioxygenase